MQPGTAGWRRGPVRRAREGSRAPAALTPFPAEGSSRRTRVTVRSRAARALLRPPGARAVPGGAGMPRPGGAVSGRLEDEPHQSPCCRSGLTPLPALRGEIIGGNIHGKHRLPKIFGTRGVTGSGGAAGPTQASTVTPLPPALLGAAGWHRCRAAAAARAGTCGPSLGTSGTSLCAVPAGAVATWGPRCGLGRPLPHKREAGNHTSLLHLPLNKKSSKCLINSLGRNKNIMRKTIWLEKKMALAGSLLLAVLVHMCLAEVVIRALANGLFTCFYIAPLYVLVILNLAAKRSSSEICEKP